MRGLTDAEDRLLASTYEPKPEPNMDLYEDLYPTAAPKAAPVAKPLPNTAKLAIAGGAALAVWFLFIRT
jgi:hypothetical protein